MATTITFRDMSCIALAFIERDDGTRVELYTGIPGIPRHRVSTPIVVTRREGPEVEGAPLCTSHAEFREWVTATYGAP